MKILLKNLCSVENPHHYIEHFGAVEMHHTLVRRYKSKCYTHLNFQFEFSVINILISQTRSISMFQFAWLRWKQQHSTDTLGNDIVNCYLETVIHELSIFDLSVSFTFYQLTFGELYPSVSCRSMSCPVISWKNQYRI